VVAIASNRPEITAEDLLAAILPSIVAGESLPSAPQTGGTVDAATVAPLVGDYSLPTGGSFAVDADDRGLLVRPTAADALAALYPRPTGDELDAVIAHEAAVVDLFAGSTAAGVDELEAVEGDLGGAFERIDVFGTVYEDRELRTYVELVVGDDVTTAWYALDAAGAVQGAELDVELPALLVAPSGGSTFEPVDPTGDGPAVTITFDGSVMTIDGGSAPVEATRG
jgi:hypothetical protein